MKFFKETKYNILQYLEAKKDFEPFACLRLRCHFEESGEQGRKAFALLKLCPYHELELGLSVEGWCVHVGGGPPILLSVFTPHV